MTPPGTLLREGLACCLGQGQGDTTRKQGGDLQSQEKGKPRGCSQQPAHQGGPNMQLLSSGTAHRYVHLEVRRQRPSE